RNQWVSFVSFVSFVFALTLEPASTTLSDPAAYSGMFSQVVTALYRSRELGTLARGARSHGDRSRATLDSLARTVPTLLRPSCAATRPADVRARPVQRQRSEIDAGDVGPCHRPDHLSRLSAFHHARGLGRRSNLAAAPRDTARAPRRLDYRWDQLSQAGDAFGRCRASVLWRAGQDRELPSRRDGRAVDGGTGVDDGGAVVSPETLAPRRRPARGGPGAGPRVLPGEMAASADVDP